MFSWKAFWERLLAILEEPLPCQKIDPQARAAALRQRFRGTPRPKTESQFFEMVCDAAVERGLVLLVIDEATALARSERGVTLLNQISVLRELADKDLFRILIVSTFDILPHLRHSGVLDRRMGTVVFSRYPEVLSASARADPGPASTPPATIDPTDPGFLAFSSSVKTFMERLPEDARFELLPDHYVKLSRGSLGCVGLLRDWYLCALVRCIDSRESRLQWKHFEDTPLETGARANLIFEARQAEEQIALLRDQRLDISEDELYKIGKLQANADRSAVIGSRSSRKRSGLGVGSIPLGMQRVGISRAVRRALP